MLAPTGVPDEEMVERVLRAAGEGVLMEGAIGTEFDPFIEEALNQGDPSDELLQRAFFLRQEMEDEENIREAEASAEEDSDLG